MDPFTWNLSLAADAESVNDGKSCSVVLGVLLNHGKTRNPRNGHSFFYSLATDGAHAMDRHDKEKMLFPCPQAFPWFTGLVDERGYSADQVSDDERLGDEVPVRLLKELLEHRRLMS